MWEITQIMLILVVYPDTVLKPCFLSLSTVGPHPAALWYVHCGNGILWLWEQQGHPTPATCRCECFLFSFFTTLSLKGVQVYNDGTEADGRSTNGRPHNSC